MKKLFEWDEFEKEDKNTVYVVLEWYWDGDGYLVNTYVDCFLTEHEALECAHEKAVPRPIYKWSIKEKKPSKTMMTPKIYMPNENIPDEDHQAECNMFLQIIKKEF